MLVVCRFCKIEKQKYRCEKNKRGGYIYRDDSGNRWDGILCPSCLLFQKRSHGEKKYGCLPRVKLNDPSNKKAVKSELMVKEFYESQGYCVQHTIGSGPDLIVVGKDEKFTVEVKSVIKSKTGFFVCPVSVLRMNDDFVAIVFIEENKIFIEPMQQHLSKCSPSGRRSVTDFIRCRKNMLYNKKTRKGRYGTKGLSYSKWGFRAYITIDEKQKHLGYFDTLQEASLARKIALDKVLGSQNITIC